VRDDAGDLDRVAQVAGVHAHGHAGERASSDLH
jgi:hypothetical protein